MTKLAAQPVRKLDRGPLSGVGPRRHGQCMRLAENMVASAGYPAILTEQFRSTLCIRYNLASYRNSGNATMFAVELSFDVEYFV
jgi:hypothetical protein